MKIAVAMSGGVDSSIAAMILKQQGHDVSGLTMLLPYGNNAPEAAAQAAAEIGIPHFVLDVREAFESDVINPFCHDYQSGRTPNPCVICNNRIKFGFMLDYALGTGAERLATGHYARLETGHDGHLQLKKGRDRRKDQSYFLCRLTTKQLSSVLFPLGDMTKQQVREMAETLGLTMAHRSESQEICFIKNGDTSAFVAERTGMEAVPGPILNAAGATVGQHRGITAYTIGQRHGLGIAAPRPLFVTRIDSTRNAVIVGEKESVQSTELIAAEVNWLTTTIPDEPFTVNVKIRYRAADAAATILPIHGGRIRINFEEPQSAITPGQTVALYDGETVLGGGVIETGEV